METQKTVIQAKPVTLSYEDQEQIITFVKDTWDKGHKARKKYKDHWEECEKAYHCEMPTIESPELDWMSNVCLPWAYDASESWYAHIHSTTIPKNDQVFTISGRTEEDHPGAEVMQKYMEYRFEQNKYAQQLGRAYDQLKIRNHTCQKVYWRKDTTIEYQWVDEPVTQMVFDPAQGIEVPTQVGTKKVRRPQEKVTFNNVWIDVVDINNFVMYPIYGDINKTTRIQETYRNYEDLIASADKTNYFNLDKLSLDDEREAAGLERKEEQKEDSKHYKGLKIKEAWIYRVKIGENVYRNYVATIVNDKTLIRFQPFPSGCPKSPFVFMALRPDGDCLYGYGLNSKGLGILKAANKKFNAWIDESTLTQHQAHKYWDDGIFNQYNVVRRPGAMIKMANAESVANNLVPIIDDIGRQQEAMADLAALKVEFETVTVPKVVKGMIEVGGNNTATEISQAQNNSNGKMHIDAYNINDYIIKPTLELSYEAIYERLQFDDTILQEIQVITQPKDENGNPMGELPVLPLPEVDIKVVGYQNVIRKQEQLANLAQALPQLAQSPAAKYLKYENIGEDVLRLMDLDTDRLWKSEEERKQADEQEAQSAQQQQQMMQEKELGPIRNQQAQQQQDFQLKSQQQQLDFELNQAELEIKRVELEIKQAELVLKQQQQDHNEQMGLHSAQMSEHQAGLAERKAVADEKALNKEKKANE
jgi:hypothetical protein